MLSISEEYLYRLHKVLEKYFNKKIIKTRVEIEKYFSKYCLEKNIKDNLETVNNLLNTKFVQTSEESFQRLSKHISGVYVGNGRSYGSGSFSNNDLALALKKYHNKKITVIILEE